MEKEFRCNMEEPPRVKYDTKTKKWFNERPFACTTVVKCEECGLYYKPCLGHKCKKKDLKEKER